MAQSRNNSALTPNSGKKVKRLAEDNVLTPSYGSKSLASGELHGVVYSLKVYSHHRN